MLSQDDMRPITATEVRRRMEMSAPSRVEKNWWGDFTIFLTPTQIANWDLVCAFRSELPRCPIVAVGQIPDETA